MQYAYFPDGVDDIAYFVEDDIMYAPHHTYNSPCLSFISSTILLTVVFIRWQSTRPHGRGSAFGMMMGLSYSIFWCYLYLYVETAAVVPL